MSRYKDPKPDGRTKLRIEPIRVNHAHAIMTEDFDEDAETGIVVARTSDNIDIGWAKMLAAAPDYFAAADAIRDFVVAADRADDGNPCTIPDDMIRALLDAHRKAEGAAS